MRRFPLLLSTTVAVTFAVLGSRALIAQDAGELKYTLQVPNGLSFAEFKGYESWQVISVSKTDTLIKAILGNPAMIDGYKAGAPFNGKVFADGAKIAKIMWKPATMEDAPNPTVAATSLEHIDFMVKDSKRFGTTAGWGYAQFDYDAALGTFKPLGSGAACGAACHKIVAAKDSVFTAYGKR